MEQTLLIVFIRLLTIFYFFISNAYIAIKTIKKTQKFYIFMIITKNFDEIFNVSETIKSHKFTF